MWASSGLVTIVYPWIETISTNTHLKIARIITSCLVGISWLEIRGAKEAQPSPI